MKSLEKLRKLDLSVKDNAAIRIAAQNGHLEIVLFLLSDDRVDASSRYNHALKIAKLKGYEAIFNALLKNLLVDG